MNTTKSPVYPPKEWSGHIRSLTHYADIDNAVFPITPEKDFVWYKHRKREIKRTELGDTYLEYPGATVFFEVKEFDKPETQPIISEKDKSDREIIEHVFPTTNTEESSTGHEVVEQKDQMTGLDWYNAYKESNSLFIKAMEGAAIMKEEHTALYEALKELYECDYTSGTHLSIAMTNAYKALIKVNPNYKKQ